MGKALVSRSDTGRGDGLAVRRWTRRPPCDISAGGTDPRLLHIFHVPQGAARASTAGRARAATASVTFAMLTHPFLSGAAHDSCGASCCPRLGLLAAGSILLRLRQTRPGCGHSWACPLRSRRISPARRSAFLLINASRLFATLPFPPTRDHKQARFAGTCFVSLAPVQACCSQRLRRFFPIKKSGARDPTLTQYYLHSGHTKHTITENCKGLHRKFFPKKAETPPILSSKAVKISIWPIIPRLPQKIRRILHCGWDFREKK